MNEAGFVSAVFPNGKVVQAPPALFGAINNAHHIRVGPPWDCSFEQEFNKPDNQFGILVDWLNNLPTKTHDFHDAIEERIDPHLLLDEWRIRLCECLASLIARSPSTRNSIRISTDYFRREMGISNYKTDDTLVAINQRDLFSKFLQEMQFGGKFVALYTSTSEFIFGDGLLHNFPAIVTHGSNLKCIVPITPNITVGYTHPLTYLLEPKLVSITLSDSEVAFFNSLIQIYSKDHIFFRKIKPEISDSFFKGEFLQLSYHKNDWLDGLFDSIARFKNW